MSFVTKEYRLTSPKLGHAAQPLSFVVISDLHNDCCGKQKQRLYDAIEGLRPDLILIAGDTIIGKPEAPMEEGLSFLREMGRRYPVYAVNGNHEYRLRIYPEVYGDMYDRYRRVCDQAGIHLLENAGENVEVQGEMITIYGYELPAEKYVRFQKADLTLAELEADMGSCDRTHYTILLAHNPRYGATYMDWGADLTLSGHYHGGIVRMPGGRGTISPHGTLFPDFCHGLFERNQSRMIVSAGLGSHTLPLRIRNPKELVHVILEMEE